MINSILGHQKKDCYTDVAVVVRLVYMVKQHFGHSEKLLLH